MRIEAVLFDFDGTLTEPGGLDFAAIRGEIGCPPGFPILEFIETLPDEPARARAHAILDRYETEAAAGSVPNSGAEDLIRFLRGRGIKAGIITRNSLRSVGRALSNFESLRSGDFAVVLSRDDPFPPKPDPDGIREAASRMGIPVERLLVVGDFRYDVEAGRRAGALTAFLTNRDPLQSCEPEPDFRIGRLDEVRDIIRLASPLPPGKLPNSFLERFLRELGLTEAPLLFGPRVGEDVAAIELDGENVLVLKSDPVTFTTDSIGVYAVTVNSNDIATCGAEPRWLLATLLFPPGVTALDVRAVMRELHDVARSLGILLCGGHTEITDAVTRPVVVCQVAGLVARGRLIDKRSMREGDHLLLTKRIALEGTAILAREMPGRLENLGIARSDLERCRALLSDPGLSILREAGIASRSGQVSAMHDVTEGGLATAVRELSAAAGRRIRVFADRIPVLEASERVCRALGLDPLGLIGSGSLLIACRPEACDPLVGAIRGAGIEAACIGLCLEAGTGVEAVRGGKPSDWPEFEVDELARLYRGDVSGPGSPPEGRSPGCGPDRLRRKQ